MPQAAPIIQDWFTNVATTYRDEIAIECGPNAVSYGILDSRSNRLANFLLRDGGGAGQSVVILSADTVWVMTAILGVLKAGGIFVPLDRRHPPARLAAMIAEVEPDWILADPAAMSQLPNGLSRTRIVTFDQATVGAPLRPQVSVDPDAPCYVYFTSGSTGRPKGIVGRLRAIAQFIRWEHRTLQVTPGIRVAQLTTPSFDAYLRDMFVPLCAGGVVCAPEHREDILAPHALLHWLERQEIHLLHCVPSLFSVLAAQPVTGENLPALRHVLLSGEPVLPETIRRWTAVFGDRIQIVNLYGPSETTMVKFAHFIRPQDAARHSIPIGKPIDGASALLLDDRGAVCSPNAVGEIHIRTPYRSLGYLNRPDLTAAAFIQNPFGNVPGDLVYKTGDLARQLPDGAYEFVGRRDAQVKIRGVRLELTEIEEALRQHPSVNEAAAVAHPDAAGNLRLCAYVTGDDVGDGLNAFLAGRLPTEMLPSSITILPELPRTLSGKLDRQALPPPLLTEPGNAPPLGDTECRLAAIWADALGVACVGRYDDFFKVGGHSLLALSVISRTTSEFGVEVPLRSLFDGPTIATFGAQVEKLCHEARVLIDQESGEL